MAEKTQREGSTLYLRLQKVKDNIGGENFGAFQYRKTAPESGVPSNWFLANPLKPDGGYLIPHTVEGTLWALGRETKTRTLKTGKEQEYSVLIAHMAQEDGQSVHLEVGDLTYSTTEDFVMKLLAPEFHCGHVLFVDAYKNKNNYNTIMLKVDGVNGSRLDTKKEVEGKWVNREFLAGLPALVFVETPNGKVATLDSQTARTKWLMLQLVQKFGPDFFKKKAASTSPDTAPPPAPPVKEEPKPEPKPEPVQEVPAAKMPDDGDLPF